MDYSLNKFSSKSPTHSPRANESVQRSNSNNRKNSGKQAAITKASPPNFSRPLNAQAKNTSRPAQLAHDPRVPQQHDGPGKFTNAQAFNFGTDPSASYRHLNFKDKSDSLTDKLKFWRPNSQLDVPRKSAVERNLQSDTGRVAAAVTGKATQQGVAHSISSQIDNMRKGSSLTFSKHNKLDVAGGSNISIMSFMAPGTTTAVNNAGVDIGWGPSLAVDANVKHDRFTAVTISRVAKENSTVSAQAQLTGTHGHKTDVKVNLHARVAAGVGADNGAFIGPSVQGSLNTGVSHDHMRIYHHVNTDTQSQTDDVMNFIARNGREKFGGEQWSSTDTKSDVKIPVAFKLEGSLLGKAPAYGDTDHGIKHIGGVGAAASIGIGDIKHPQTSAFIKGEAGGSLNTSIAGKSFNDEEGGALSGAHGRAPQGLKLESEKLNLHQQPADQHSYHMSYVNHPFGHNSHANRLEDKYGEGMLDRIHQGFRDAFDHDDIPNRRKTVIEKTFADGRTEIRGQFEATARQGKTHKIPTVPLSFSNYAEGNIDTDPRLLFTIPSKPTN